MRLTEALAKFIYESTSYRQQVPQYFMSIQSMYKTFGIEANAPLAGGSKYNIRVKDATYTVTIYKNDLCRKEPRFPVSTAVDDTPVNKSEYVFMTSDDKEHCASLVVNKTSQAAYVSIVNNHRHCVLNRGSHVTDSVGTVMMWILIEWCKRYHVRELKLDDLSSYKCNAPSDGPLIRLKVAHTLTHGQPWYYEFGFSFDDADEHQIVKQNRHHFQQLKTSSYPLHNMTDDVSKMIDRNRLGLEKSDVLDDLERVWKQVEHQPLGMFVRHLQRKHCLLFSYMYERLFDACGYAPFKTSSMTLIMSY